MMNHTRWMLAVILLYAGAVFSAEKELSVYFKNMSGKDVSVWIGSASDQGAGAAKQPVLASQQELVFLGKIQKDQSFFYSYKSYSLLRPYVYEEPFESFSAYQGDVLLELFMVPSGSGWEFDTTVRQLNVQGNEKSFAGRSPIVTEAVKALTLAIGRNIQGVRELDAKMLTDFPQIFIKAGVDEGRVQDFVVALRNYDQLIANGVQRNIDELKAQGDLEGSKRLQLTLEAAQRAIFSIMNTFW